jgi:hypothetical protein
MVYQPMLELLRFLSTTGPESRSRSTSTSGTGRSSASATRMAVADMKQDWNKVFPG